VSGDRSAATGFGAGPIHVAPLTTEAVSALCALATSLGLQCARIDLSGCADKADLLRRMARALEFPDWFGENWDALFDCLTDLSWRPADGYVLVLERADPLRQRAPEVFEAALGILADAAAAWRERGVPFRAFVSADPADR